MLASILLASSALLALTNAAAINARADSCGVKGYDKISAYGYYGGTTFATLALCGAKCKADTQCKSFGFGPSACLLYTQTITANINVDPTSPYSFYDVGCVATPTTSSTTVASTASPSPTPSQLCGGIGYDLGVIRAYGFDPSGAAGTYAVCSARCIADPNCKGFAYNPGAECLLYAVPCSTNFAPNSNSITTFYDRTCVNTTANTTTSSTTTSNSTTSTAPAPTQTFCLQVTGTGPPGKGYYAYTANTATGIPALYFTSSTNTTATPQLFYISAPFGTPYLYDLLGRRLEFAYRPSNPSPPQEQPLQWVPTLTPGDQSDYQILNCGVGPYSNLVCSAGASGFVWNTWAVDNASFATVQRLYLQTTGQGAKNTIGLTVVQQSLCPQKAVANP